MAPRSRPADRLPEPLQQWKDSLSNFLSFQQRCLRRVTDYTTGIADLTQSRSVDPGEWIEKYALLMNGIVHEMGDWMLERDEAGDGPLPLYQVTAKPKRGSKDPISRRAYLPVQRAKLRVKEGTTGVPLHIPASAFKNRRGMDPKLTLMSEGLLHEGGGAPLPSTHVVFVPAVVRRSKPEAELKIYDVAGAGNTGKYRGFVWLKETNQPIAAVEIDVKCRSRRVTQGPLAALAPSAGLASPALP